MPEIELLVRQCLQQYRLSYETRGGVSQDWLDHVPLPRSYSVKNYHNVNRCYRSQ